MRNQFKALLELLKEPLRLDGGVKTDNSILMVYPPEKELDFRDHLLDKFLPLLQARGLDFRVLDLSGFLFTDFDSQTIENLQEDEFEDYTFLKQGLSQRVKSSLVQRVTALAQEVPGGTVIVYATVALFPLIRFGEALKGLRDLQARIVLAFPGEERGGKLHFMNQPDGGNYLAVKLT